MAHLYWRLHVTAASSSGVLVIDELAMHDASGTYLPTGGTAIASSSQGGFPASNAFDQTFNTYWLSVGAPSGGSPEWLGYHFASAVDVATVRITGQDGNHEPATFTIQHSDDGVTWTDATSSITTTAWATNWVISLSVAVAAPSSGSYVNWRAFVTTTQNGADPICAELELHSVVGGSRITTTTVEYQIGTAIFIQQAFDSLPTSVATPNAGPGTFFLGYAFPQPVTVVEVCWTADPGTDFPTSPTAIDVQGSNDAGATWTTVFSVSMGPWTTGGQHSCAAAITPVTAQPYVWVVM